MPDKWRENADKLYYLHFLSIFVVIIKFSPDEDFTLSI